MGDLSNEPSMEDILSSIKRIIAEEGDQPARRARPARTSPAVPLSAVEADDDAVLELSEALPAARASSSPWPEPAEAAPTLRPVAPRAAEPSHAEPSRAEPIPVEAPQATPAQAEPIVSTAAAAASRGALESLSRMLVKPEPGNDGTLEGMIREMLRPMLREWLDANLPAMVETMVAREIARIARP